MIKNKNILITGATGFIGYNLVKELVLHNKIFCIVRKSSDITRLQQFSGIVFINYENSLLELKTQLKDLKIELTYHLASLFIAEHDSTHVDDLILSNILFPTQLLEVLSECGYTNIVNTGTSWQTYSSTDSSPVCLYSATKQSFEEIIKYYTVVKNISCITLRIYDTYGLNDNRKKLFWMLDNARESNEILGMSMGAQRINLLYIDDITRAFITAGNMLLSSPIGINKVYGVYDSVDYSIKEVVSMYERIYGATLNIQWGSRPYRNREVMNPYYGLEVLEGWVPQISLDQGITFLKRKLSERII